MWRYCKKKTETARTIGSKIVGPVNVFKCRKCGAEYLSEKEYEKLFDKIESIKTRAKIVLQKP